MTNAPLSLFIGGILLLITGLVFHFMRWPQDMFYGIFTGPLLMLAGLIGWFFKRKRNG